jgi:hypothetical protein
VGGVFLMASVLTSWNQPSTRDFDDVCSTPHRTIIHGFFRWIRSLTCPSCEHLCSKQQDIPCPITIHVDDNVCRCISSASHISSFGQEIRIEHCLDPQGMEKEMTRICVVFLCFEDTWPVGESLVQKFKGYRRMDDILDKDSRAHWSRTPQARFAKNAA